MSCGCDHIVDVSALGRVCNIDLPDHHRVVA